VYFAGKKQPELVDPAKVKDVAVAMFLSEKVEGT
jgi:hypothetical protein